MLHQTSDSLPQSPLLSSNPHTQSPSPEAIPSPYSPETTHHSFSHPPSPSSTSHAKCYPGPSSASYLSLSLSPSPHSPSPSETLPKSASQSPSACNTRLRFEGSHPPSAGTNRTPTTVASPDFWRCRSSGISLSRCHPPLHERIRIRRRVAGRRS